MTSAILLFFAVAVIASDREPPGSTTSTFVDHKNNTVVYSNSVSGSNWTLKINPPPTPIPLPHIYKEAASGILFYVESDGRHVTAINPDGKILWSSDPFADAHLEFYRTKTPRIVYIGKVSQRAESYWVAKGKRVIGITFNSSQFGEIDMKTGEFMSGGRD